MSNKQYKYLFKIPSSKFFILLWFSSLLIGLVYAAEIIFPSSAPSWMTSNGSFSTQFANMFVSCPANEFLKGFDTNLNRVCVPSDGTYNGVAISSIPASTSGSYPGTPAGQITGGKFGNFFQKLSWLCPWNTIVKGFASDGWKYCVVPATPTNYTLHTPVIPSGITMPSTPSWQSAGGKFQDFFTRMFITCSGVQVIKGFDANGNPNCANNKQTLSCWGSIPANAAASTITTYVQTWNGSIWAPTTSWTNAAASCGFTCNTHYIWNGSSCVGSIPATIVTTAPTGCYSGLVATTCNTNGTVTSGAITVNADCNAMPDNQTATLSNSGPGKVFKCTTCYTTPMPCVIYDGVAHGAIGMMWLNSYWLSWTASYSCPSGYVLSGSICNPL